MFWVLLACFEPHTHSHTPHPFLPFPVPVPSSHSFPIFLETYGHTHTLIKPSQIEETKHIFRLVRLVGVQPYPFQVRIPSFSRRTHDARFWYCSCTRNFSCFWEFQACRKLGEVPRRLGVVRLKVLDVGIVSFEFGRSWGYFPGEISWILALESGMIVFLSL